MQFHRWSTFILAIQLNGQVSSEAETMGWMCACRLSWPVVRRKRTTASACSRHGVRYSRIHGRFKKIGSLQRWFISLVAQGSIAVGKFASNFDGEVAAISETARVTLPLLGTKKVVFLTNLISALQALCFPTIQEGWRGPCAKNYYNYLTKKSEIALQLVPGHCNVQGNEKADDLSKQGCNMNQPDPHLTYSISIINRTVANYVNNARKQASEVKEINLKHSDRPSESCSTQNIEVAHESVAETPTSCSILEHRALELNISRSSLQSIL
ncbi:hypothetical protein CDAR_212691 [Caerostris darwini]|uniref:RNase H type-1 domain-containing protein n=1 Tax=Caerostris darwini TaxID=1538125 RepID=A0AAV4PX00_9ARAC|nr:hypothetical protein CDAR_212691 [Caerostris darwini]